MSKAGMEANPGSKTVTHKTMKMRSNTKGVPEVRSTLGSPQIGKGVGNITKGSMPTSHQKRNI